MSQKKLPLINSAHGSETRNIINELIKLFNGMGYTYNESLQKAQDVLNEAKQTNDMNENVQKQINTLVAESGTSDAELLQARFDTDGLEYDVLKERLDAEYKESRNIDSANDDRSFYEGIKLNRRHKAIMSIVDDDGYPQVYDMLKPLTEQEGVPITIATITGRVGTSELSMNLQQLKECQAAGMEIQSHTHTHQALSSLTYEEQENEIKKSKEWLQANGFSTEAIIYPFGATNVDTYEITNRYHSAGVYIDSGDSFLNGTPIRRERLERVYYNLTSPVTVSDKNRVQHCKDKIDEAIATDSWIIIGLHCFYDGFDPEGLREVIQYAKQKGIEIVSLKRGLELYDNVIDLPDFQIGADGNLYSNKLGHMQKMVAATSASTPLSNFPKDAYSYRLFNASAASSAGLPEARAGILLTFRGVSDDYGYQIYQFTALNRSYKRRWSNNDATWTPWHLESPNWSTKDQSFNVGTIPAQSTKDFTMTSSPLSAETIPFLTTKTQPQPGIIYTSYINSDGMVVVRIANLTTTVIDCGTMIFSAGLLLQLQ